MRKILYMILLLFISTDLCSQAQQKEIDRSMELHVGQELPDLPRFSLLNYGSQEVKLESLSNKVVILDFFDTTCYGCILALPKLQKLQDELSDKLQVIVVAWQDRATIESFFSTNAYVQKHDVQLPVIYSDTLLRKYFPHTGVPHHVWLFKNRVQAVTHGDFARTENVERLYYEGRINLPLKSDFGDERIASSFDGSLMGSARLMGYKDGMPADGLHFSVDSVNASYTASFYNVDPLGAYSSVLARIKKPSFLLKEERIVWKVKNVDQYRYKPDDKGKDIWLLKHALSYERSEAKQRSEAEVASSILIDLNSFLGLDVRWEKRQVDCLVLQKTSEKAKDKIDNGVGGLGGTGVLAFMIDYQAKLPPVVDEVDSEEVIYLDNFDSLEAINQQLAPQGLVLKAARRSLEVLIFEEVDQ